MTDNIHNDHVAIIGGGPAGLMAAEVLSQAGVRAAVYEAMPSVGRKFLLAGRGGLNLTHSEDRERFLSRYGSRRPQIEPLLQAFGPDDLRAWAAGLGIETFVGSSGRVFPVQMKASPLLRAWLTRLQDAGVTFHLRHRWQGWHADGSLRFTTPEGESQVSAKAVVLAVGGGSWSRLGSDGAWVPWLTARGVTVAALRPANCGFDVAWSKHFRERFAGQPLKTVTLSFTDSLGNSFKQQGECLITETGVEGSLIYAVSALVRDELEAKRRQQQTQPTSSCDTRSAAEQQHSSASKTAVIYLDLAPHRPQAWLQQRLAKPRGSRSQASHIQSQTRLKGVKTGLLREFVRQEDFANPARLAAAIKALPIPLIAPRPLDEAISSAGGVTFNSLNEHLMLQAIPGTFCAGEMLDWEAPTGGYLLTACFASGFVAGHHVLTWLRHTKEAPHTPP
ncbi:MAG: aminoacetone oxidase family FAD-binding enzyme [Chloroflexi bacterium]|nr:MAG: aminoacetone oxidase family FAD-binding enzyme [Chloroflexota bacterium]